jgi:DNA-binding response OmpR family regulator
MKLVEKKELSFYAKDRVVLVVEDEDISLKIVNNVLEEYFSKIILTKDGKEALDIFNSGTKIDLVITDVDMPHISGIELARKIKAKTDIPVLILSGNEDKDTFVNLINIGIDKFIPKPFDINLLVLSLKQVLEALIHKEFLKSLTKFDTTHIKQAVEAEEKIIKIRSKYSTKVGNITIREFLLSVLESGLSDEEIDAKFNSISVEGKILEKLLQDIVLFSSDIEYQVSLDKIEELFYESSKRFLSMHYKIAEFEMLKDLSDVFLEFYHFFDTCKSFDNFTNEQILELMDLEFILIDIKNCINELFIENSSENICIYPDMLDADLRQLEAKIQTDTTDDDHGELDFF